MPPSGIKTCRAGSCICHQSRCLAHVPTPHCPHACASAFPALSLARLHPPPGLLTQSRGHRNSIQGLEEETGQPCSLSLPRCKWGRQEEPHPGQGLLPEIYKIIVQTWTSSWRFRQRESLPCSVFNPCPLCFAAPFALLPCPCEVPPPSPDTGVRAPFSGTKEPLGSGLKPLRSADSAWLAAPGFPTLEVSHATSPSPHPWSLLAAGRSSSLPACSSLSHPAQPASPPPHHCSLLFFCPVDHKSLEKLFGEANHFYSSSLPSLWISGSLTL